MERGKPGKRDRKSPPLWKQTEAAFGNQDIWDQIASNNTEGSDSKEPIKCDVNCKYFYPFSGPKVRDGTYSPDEGRCRVKKIPKKGFPRVSYRSSLCLHPGTKGPKRQ